VERDAHGHVRLAEFDLGDILKKGVLARLRGLGIDITVASKNIGYELRCADPIPFDVEYTRMLGYCATKFLLAGGHAAMVSLQAGKFVPIPFAEMIDPKTGRARVRRVDITSTSYAIARRYMIRLRRDDFEEPAVLAKLAATARLSPGQFCAEFEYLAVDEPPPLKF
jgi:6-phosphofructokinase 1